MVDAIDADITRDDFDDERTRVVIEKHVHTQIHEPKSSIPAFLAGFLTASLLAAVGAIVFLAVSDRDDDGNLRLDVPEVDVSVDE